MHRSFAAIGNGSASCGGWSADQSIAQRQWILGLLSGIAAASGPPDYLNPLKGVDAAGGNCSSPIQVAFCGIIRLCIDRTGKSA
jgi:hypothetical protein